jgi:hypothetical protein
MHCKLFILMMFLTAPVLLTANPVSSTVQHGFVGAEVCGMCHHTDKQGKQLEIWKNSKHAQAYKTLQTSAADKIAKEKGFSTPAAKTPECLKCHASGYNAEASLLGAKFKIEDGVQCESCHGGGADYKTLNVMKDKIASVKAGLELHTNMKTSCTKCHNSQSPTYKPFNVELMWAKIKHTVPAAGN